MGGVGEPDGSSVEKYGSDNGFVCDDYGFLLLAPVGASKSFENVEAGGDAGDEIVNVWAEGEVGVEGDPQDAGVSFEGDPQDAGESFEMRGCLSRCGFRSASEVCNLHESLFIDIFFNYL